MLASIPVPFLYHQLLKILKVLSHDSFLFRGHVLRPAGALAQEPDKIMLLLIHPQSYSEAIEKIPSPVSSTLSQSLNLLTIVCLTS
jgi:hypothetical protein